MMLFNYKLFLGCCLAVVALATTLPAMAATVMFEDFETSPVDGLPNADGYALEKYGDDLSNPDGFLIRTAQDGALFDDPIGPAGNKSAVWDNNDHGTANDGPTQATLGYNWFPTKFDTGSIEFDFYMETAPSGGIVYLDFRGGHRDDTTIGLNTASSNTLNWFDMIADDAGSVQWRMWFTGIDYDSASVLPVVDAVNHMKMDYTPGFVSYTLNGTLAEFDITAGGSTSVIPWYPDATSTGVSGMQFTSDTSTASHGLYWLDNLNVQQIPEPATGSLALISVVSLVWGLRRKRS